MLFNASTKFAFHSKTVLVGIAAIFVIGGSAFSFLKITGEPASTGGEKKQLEAALAKVEMSFEANQGQTDPSVGFLARGGGYALFLKPDEAVFSLSANEHTGASDLDLTRPHAVSFSKSELSAQKPAAPSVIRLKLLGADPKAAAVGVDELAGKTNYFIGSDPSKWRTNVPTYGRVRYDSVYPGIDVDYYGNQSQLEYDFRVAPGSDYRQITLKFDGAESVTVDDATGDLLIEVTGGTLRQQKPFIYQELNGTRTQVEGRFALSNSGHIGFEIADYDLAKPLIIDPVLVYSTYLGGTGGDGATGIAVDSEGYAYITGDTSSSNFPTLNPAYGFQGGNENSESFVTKINITGTQLIYSTYFGGNATDPVRGIAVDSQGSAYITGIARSTDFPTVNAMQSTREGNYDAFVLKVHPSGSSLAYSTYLGGPAADYGYAIDVDTSGNAYVAGSAGGDFPMVGAVQSEHRGGDSEAFFAKLNSAGSALVYSSYLGGSANDTASGIGVDAEGNAYIVGYTHSSNFPSVSAFQSAIGQSGDAFITKVNSTGTALLFSTFLGGSRGDGAYAIAVDDAGKAFVTGATDSSDFPLANPLDNSIAGTGPYYRPDGFVTALNADGTLIYSTYLGGSSDDTPRGIAVDSEGNAHVAGVTVSSDFPTFNPLQETIAGAEDVFVTKIAPDGQSLVFSTYVGGTLSDSGRVVGVDPSGNTYVAGETWSPNFPTAFPYQDVRKGNIDAFVLKIGNSNFPVPTPTPVQPGALDPSFGTNGKTVVTIPNVYGATAVAIQPDKKIVLACGTSTSVGNSKFVVVRLHPDGAIDTGFGTGGSSTFAFSSVPAREDANAIAIQPDGKILIAGHARPAGGPYEYAVARLNSDGSLDPTFGTDGRAMPHVTPGDDFAYDIALQADGKIILAGKSRPSANDDASLVRLTATGQLDTSFNGTGKILIAGTGGLWYELFHGVTVQPDGKIVVVGGSSPAGDAGLDFVLFRFNTNGSFDSNFGSGGRVITPIGYTGTARSVALQPDGKIIAGGFSNSGSANFAAVTRYQANGMLDLEFGNSGKATIEIHTPRFGVVKTVLRQSDGRIIGVGSETESGSFGDFMVARFDQNGYLDQEFGTGGLVYTKFGYEDSAANDAALQSDQTLIVVGYAKTPAGLYGIGVARYALTTMDPPTPTPTPAPTPTPTPTPIPTPTPSPLANISVSGRVLNPTGSGLRAAMVRLTDKHGNSRSVTTSSLGYFSFADVPAGEISISVSSRRYRFEPRALNLLASAEVADMIGIE